MSDAIDKLFLGIAVSSAITLVAATVLLVAPLVLP
jgi:hypothetical protein